MVREISRNHIGILLFVLVIALEGGLYGIYGPRVDCLLHERSEGNNRHPRAINPIKLDWKCDYWLIVYPKYLKTIKVTLSSCILYRFFSQLSFFHIEYDIRKTSVKQYNDFKYSSKKYVKKSLQQRAVTVC